MQVEGAGALLRVTLGERTIYWPSRDSLPRLLQFYLESFDPTNPHAFEAPGTVVDDGDVVLDIGGGEGYFALKALERASKVFILEPAKAWRRCLEKTFEAELAAGRVALVPILLGRENSEVSFVENENDPGLAHILRPGQAPSAASPVSMKTIDSFVAENDLERVDFIKADVEGAEIDLIKGAKETLAHMRPKIAITTYHHIDHANLLVELILSLVPAYRYHVKGAVDFPGGPRPVVAHFWCERD